MTTLFFIKKTSLVFGKNWYFRGLAPMETKSPEWMKLVFLAPKKRLKEALFGAYKNSFINEDL
jgi:hypothetical protein